MSENAGPHGSVAYALATWVFLLHVDGIQPDDQELTQHCAAVAAAEEEAAGNLAGEALVTRVATMLSDSSPGAVEAFARGLYGDRLSTDLGQGDRGDRIHRIRKLQFATNRPWLARIWERDASSGEVGPAWLVVEAVTDVVRAMDPNPWNDIDENRAIPVDDFQVLWELDGCTAIAVT